MEGTVSLPLAKIDPLDQSIEAHARSNAPEKRNATHGRLEQLESRMDTIEAHQGNQIDFRFVGLVDAPVDMYGIGMQLWQQRPVATAYCALICEDGSADVEVDHKEHTTTGRVELLVVP